MSDTVLVIGSNSFSGASFIGASLERGNKIIGLSRSQEAPPVFLPYKWNTEQSAFQFQQLDLNNDLDEIVSLIKKEKPSTIVNFAAQSMVGQSWETPEHWFQTNVVSTIKLHNCLRHMDFLDKYAHITTPEVYGSTSGFIKEDTPYNPSTPYAVSRATADMNLKCFFETYGFPVVSTRAANVYGPGQQLYRIIPRAILFILLAEKLQLHGGGLSERSFIHMDDVSDATWKIIDGGKIGETYHISTNEIITIRELVERICDKLGADFSQSVDVVGDRLGKDSAYKLDSTKIRESLSWVDTIDLDSGLDSCIRWVKDNLDTFKSQPFDYQHKP
jgi:dTDP-glucose 4,6-dehydratase